MKTATDPEEGIALARDAAQGIVMRAGTTGGAVATEITGAGEKTPATGLEDAGTILLTPGAKIDGPIAGTGA